MVKLSNKRTAEETRKLLDAADALATFANLETDGVENFRHQYPEFVPQMWWTGLSWMEGAGVHHPWVRERDLLRKAWAAGFPAELTLELATSSRFLMAHAMAADTTKETPTPVWDYQRAVMFVANESWRAKFCQECGQVFIADHASRKYCSIASSSGMNCSALVIKRTHLEWGRKNNWGRPTKKTTKSKATKGARHA